jgi:hypothetical protein
MEGLSDSTRAYMAEIEAGGLDSAPGAPEIRYFMVEAPIDRADPLTASDGTVSEFSL